MAPYKTINECRVAGIDTLVCVLNLDHRALTASFPRRRAIPSPSGRSNAPGTWTAACRNFTIPTPRRRTERMTTIERASTSRWWTIWLTRSN